MTNPNIIPEHLMGEVWPSVQPGRTRGDLGSVRIEPSEPARVRSMQTYRLVYTVGRFGLDDTGGLKVVQRFTHDGGDWQITDPGAMNHVTASASNGVLLDIEIERSGHQRPWERSMCITVRKGHLRQGDTIVIVLGDRSKGGPGLRMPTFCESAHEFRVLVDPCATRQFMPLRERPAIEILPGEQHAWRAILPTLRKPGAKFPLTLRADDLWGNPSDLVEGNFGLAATGPLDGLPERIEFRRGQRALRIAGLTATGAGVIRVALSDDAGNVLVRSNPLVVREGVLEAFWGDLHGQSGETVGVNPIREYFTFGRDLAALDVMGHQANDFQIKAAFWDEINTVTAELHQPGLFVTFPGYEWSGNTPTGGDHNVFFRHEGRPIVRSSHAMLEDRSDLDCDANTTTELFDALSGEDCVVYAHVGGRPANIAQCDGAALRTAVEIHSDWGTFEWIMADSFDLGYRHGLVCNSDGHKGRPGASHPGASSFGAFGGLTCFLASELTRDGIFDAMRRRHHYGTTGGRLHLDVTAEFASAARLFESDPRLGEARSNPAETAMMGDIVAVSGDSLELHVSAQTQSPLLSIDMLRGMECVRTVRPYGPDALGRRYRICFHGAEYRGRGRETRWHGHARLQDAQIERFETVNAWNHDSLLRARDPQLVEFDVETTGNFIGFDIWLDCDGGEISVVTGHASGRIDLGSMGCEPLVLEAGGLHRKVTLQRLPDTLETCSLEASAQIALNEEGDTPVWTRVATEDGHLAWSSPIYAFRDI